MQKPGASVPVRVKQRCHRDDLIAAAPMAAVNPPSMALP
jgi:hypothetical protein